jgi:hypothetical protein
LLTETAFAKPRIGVEPYMGYSQFSYSENTVQDRKYGTILGGKGGVYLTDKFWLALDYHLGGPYHLDKNNNEYLNRMWGAGLGLRNSTNGRLWLGYYYDAVIDDIERNILFKGIAYKISVGFEFQSKLNLNFEYCVQNYTRVRAYAYEFPSKLDVSVMYVSISSPLFL